MDKTKSEIEIIHSDCLEYMKTMEDNSIDFIVTDPPYGLHFMGKSWDNFKKSNFDESESHKYLESSYCSGERKRNIRRIDSANAHSGTYDHRRDDEFQSFMYQVSLEILRILKPGGQVAMFGSTRRHHRQMIALEDAGFEIRDMFMWLFGQGFPKSHNNFGFSGYGTALKPAYEPIILAMKPLDGTFAQNVEKWGIGGINIDESRIGINGGTKKWSFPKEKSKEVYGDGINGSCEIVNLNKGRWPSNLLLDESAAEQLDQMKGNNVSRFFYCAKSSTSERNRGLDKSCTHPTVKPISLMKYLLKLIAPPGNSICLDPFAGSGSTLVAAKELGISCIGIEKEEEYCEIARKRIAQAKEPEPEMFDT